MQATKMAVRRIPLMIFILSLCLNIENKIASAQCQGDLQGLIQECSKYVQKSGPKIAPSQSCCRVLKGTDIPCVCKHIGPDAENVISFEKAVYVTNFCAKPIPHGTKCGSYTVP